MIYCSNFLHELLFMNFLLFREISMNLFQEIIEFFDLIYDFYFSKISVNLLIATINVEIVLFLKLLLSFLVIHPFFIIFVIIHFQGLLEWYFGYFPLEHLICLRVIYHRVIIHDLNQKNHQMIYRAFQLVFIHPSFQLHYHHLHAYQLLLIMELFFFFLLFFSI